MVSPINNNRNQYERAPVSDPARLNALRVIGAVACGIFLSCCNTLSTESEDSFYQGTAGRVYIYIGMALSATVVYFAACEHQGWERPAPSQSSTRSQGQSSTQDQSSTRSQGHRRRR